MDNSVKNSNLGFSRIGDDRILTPLPLKALDLWFMLRLWPDAHDREDLLSIQRSVHTSPPVQFKTKRAPLSSFDAVLRRITGRDFRFRQYTARHLFAAAARQAADQYQMRRPFDLFAVYANLVLKVYTSQDGLLFYGDEPKPVELVSMVGAIAIDSDVSQNPDNAVTIAALIMEAITQTYPDAR